MKIGILGAKMKFETYGIQTIGLEEAIESKKVHPTSAQKMFDWMNEKGFNHIVVEFTKDKVVYHNPVRH